MARRNAVRKWQADPRVNSTACRTQRGGWRGERNIACEHYKEPALNGRVFMRSERPPLRRRATSLNRHQRWIQGFRARTPSP
jgi:hypothetical protein